MTSAEKRNKVVSAVESREGKNQYTQNSTKRVLVAYGWSDCSSLQDWAYQQIGMNIGSYTGAQIEAGTWVTQGGSYPDESLLKKGDELFFATNYNNGRPHNVGHIEMYVGNGQISGHGSGIGPTRKNMVSYCKKRNASGKKYIGVKRYIKDDGSTSTPTTPTPTNKGDTYMFSCKEVKKGEKGTHVYLVQEILRARGIKGADGKDLTLDMDCGANTVHAITEYQRRREKASPGICGGVDGVAGYKTLKDMIALPEK